MGEIDPLDWDPTYEVEVWQFRLPSKMPYVEVNGIYLPGVVDFKLDASTSAEAYYNDLYSTNAMSQFVKTTYLVTFALQDLGDGTMAKLKYGPNLSKL